MMGIEYVIPRRRYLQPILPEMNESSNQSSNEIERSEQMRLSVSRPALPKREASFILACAC